MKVKKNRARLDFEVFYWKNPGNEILNNKNKLLDQFYKHVNGQSHIFFFFLKTTGSTIDKDIFEWFCDVWAYNIPLSGRLSEKRH